MKAVASGYMFKINAFESHREAVSEIETFVLPYFRIM